MQCMHFACLKISCTVQLIDIVQYPLRVTILGNACISCILCLFLSAEEEGVIRLMGGSGPHEGRVEVYYNGTWGTVCGDDWDLQDALVVCRQLGYTNATAAPVTAKFGSGNGSVVYTGGACTGFESSLADCGLNGTIAQHCVKGEDAGAVCEGIIRLITAANVHDWINKRTMSVYLIHTWSAYFHHFLFKRMWKAGKDIGLHIRMT